MRILFLSRWFPYPPDNGSKIRIFNLIKSLSLKHEIHLISFISDEPSSDHLSEMSAFCSQIIPIKYNSFNPKKLSSVRAYFAPEPRSMIDTFSVELDDAIKHICEINEFDLVIASQIEMARYAQSIHGIPKIFEELELTVLYEDFDRQKNMLKRFRKRLTWWKSVRYIRNLVNKFNGCTVVSQNERELCRKIIPAYSHIEIIPNGINVADYEGNFGVPVENTLIFTGALTYGVNFDGIQYFLNDILDKVLAEKPETKLTITGKLDGVAVNQLPQNDAVIYSGYLKDIRLAIQRSWVNVVPLRFGGGTRLKILESLALGTPVISTPKGAEGLELQPGHDILIAHSPDEFANLIVQLLNSPELRHTLSSNGRKVVLEKYNWKLIVQKFEEFQAKYVSG